MARKLAPQRDLFEPVDRWTEWIDHLVYDHFYGLAGVSGLTTDGAA